MKNPLRYQMTEYDCGPTSMLNAVSYLFQREEIPPEIVRSIMLYCLDCFGSDGASGKCGTSCMAMMFLSNWINSFGQTGHLPISSKYLSGQSVNFSQNSALRDALRRGGAAVVQVDLEGWHYVLLTHICGDQIFLFDPIIGRSPSAPVRSRWWPTTKRSITASFPSGIWRRRCRMCMRSARWKAGRRSSSSTTRRC